MTPATTTTTSTHDRVEGKVHEVKGAIKQKVADVKKDPNLHDEGTAERIDGTIERKVGDIKKVFDK
ncbi:CsbD family protein [Acidicapsa dinghuensis]|uniref:CsbD family protein n=1 Tax=Acidicapsa dinghuensis TaxID=2218256 RepID=A0ABW1ECB6_9BACT|nr:CsbD family protein [Acidicapsa dinghuensis]